MCFYSYGFGALNALQIVSKAQSWINVPEQKSCKVPSLITNK